MQFGFKLNSKNLNYTQDILSLFDDKYFQYIELLILPESYDCTIEYWKQFSIPIIIHAPHSLAGMNLSIKEDREINNKKLQETFLFADNLKSEFIIFHCGVNGSIDEAIYQLRPYIDKRCLIENKPIKGLNGEKCIGTTPEEIKKIVTELQSGFCLDFGHAICAANTVKKNPMEYIQEFFALKPQLYHLTDGDYSSEKDTHYHYGKGTFPLKELFKMVPDYAKITNEAKHDSETDLNDFKEDFIYIKNIFDKELF